jgi:rfaE bifunctional protein nucleotidyltransferase chain/domain
MQYFEKRFEPGGLARLTKVWRLKNDTIVFTNGCFDILHPGHVDYLHKAKALGNRLIVGVNTDASVRRQGKGPSRPLNSEDARLCMLGALHSVDAVVLFDDDTPLDLIRLLEPDVLVKGGDYNPSQSDPSSREYIVGSAEVKNRGGQVVAIPLLEGYSTTSLVERILGGAAPGSVVC